PTSMSSTSIVSTRMFQGGSAGARKLRTSRLRFFTRHWLGCKAINGGAYHFRRGSSALRPMQLQTHGGELRTRGQIRYTRTLKIRIQKILSNALHSHNLFGNSRRTNAG